MLDVEPGLYRHYKGNLSYMEPGSDLTCGHPDAGVFGLTIREEPLAHCPGFSKFQQHPLRNADGTLKGL